MTKIFIPKRQGHSETKYGQVSCFGGISYKLLMVVYHIYNLSAVWDKDELVTFLGQKIEDQGHKLPKGILIDSLLMPITS